MGQGLTGGTHTYSRFRDLVFGAIPEGLEDPAVSDNRATTSTRRVLAGSPSLIGDSGNVAFDGMIGDSYGSAETFKDMFDFLHTQFFPRCAWGPMYLKGDKCHFFRSSLGFVGLEAGENGLRPSIKKRDTILKWPTPTTFEEVEAFCFLTPFLRRFIPGRAELVRVMKYGSEYYGNTVKKKYQEEEFTWTMEKDVAFQAIKQAIANNAMAAPDPSAQYHLAVDASKKGLGGVLFQLAGVPPRVEATHSTPHREAERIVMFISFKLADTETRYSNSEREALAVVRCLAEIRWMVIASEVPILVYTDHEALRVLLTGVDNDAHGRIAKWQEQLGEYNLKLLHRSSTTHFIGIADGLSRLPTRWLPEHIAEDSEAPKPILMTRQQQCGLVTTVNTANTTVPVTCPLPLLLRAHRCFWLRGESLDDDGIYSIGKVEEKGMESGGRERGAGLRLVDRGRISVAVVGVDGQEGVRSEESDGRIREVVWEGNRSESIQGMASNLRWRKWEQWLSSKFYSRIVQLRLYERDGNLRNGI